MGRTITPTYRVEAEFADNTGTSATWHTRANGHQSDGLPTDQNLKKWVEALERSTQPGGCNAHCGLIVVFSAKIIHQKTRRIVATYRGPSFVVIN